MDYWYEAVPRYTEVDFDYFEDHILPALPQGLSVDSVVAELERNGSIVDGRWKDFPVFECPNYRVPEESHACFADLIRTILSTAANVKSLDPEHAAQTFDYRSFPEGIDVELVPVYWPNRISRATGYFAPAGQPTIVHWHDIGVAGQYLCFDYDEDEEKAYLAREQILSDMQLQLYEDPRRRFVLMYTIVDTAMRLWFCNRSFALVSQAFDFVTDYECFVRFVLRVAYAKDHEVGWDITMQLLPAIDGNNVGLMYDITVDAADGQVVYRTKKLLRLIDAYYIVGKGTRIWEAVRIQDGQEIGDLVVLKDCWTNASLAHEAETIEALSKADESEEFQQAISDTILPIECCGDVLILGRPDRTGVCPSEPEGVLFTGKTLWPRSLNRNPEDKQHRRVVYQRVGSLLYTHKQLDIVFNALGTLTLKLQKIHEAGPGWVHRDISPGNIFLSTEDQRVKLAGFDFAKEITKRNDSDLEFGTTGFIAVEAHACDYQFLNYVDHDEEISDSTFSVYSREKRPWHKISYPCAHRGLETFTPKRRDRPLRFKNKPAFFYNALHDLESVWWTALLLLFGGEVQSCRNMPEAPFDPRRQMSHAAELTQKYESRVFSMDSKYHIYKHLRELHPALQPAAMMLIRIKHKIVNLYRVAEDDIEDIGKDVASELYSSMAQALQQASGLLSREQVVFK